MCASRDSSRCGSEITLALELGPCVQLHKGKFLNNHWKTGASRHLCVPQPIRQHVELLARQWMQCSGACGCCFPCSPTWKQQVGHSALSLLQDKQCPYLLVGCTCWKNCWWINVEIKIPCTRYTSGSSGFIEHSLQAPVLHIKINHHLVRSDSRAFCA